MKASVIIPSYNRTDWLKKTLTSVLIQKTDDIEVLTIFQGDDDAKLRQWCAAHSVRYLYLDQPSTPRARNTGVKAAQGEICIFFDDDVLLDAGCLAAHLSCYQDSTVVGVAGRVITMRSGQPDQVRQTGRGIGRVTGLGRVAGDQEYNSLTRQVGKITPLGCNMSFRKSVIEQVGYFDETYIGNAMREETDLAVRALSRGVAVFEPKAAVTHFLAKGGSRQKSKTEWYSDFFFNEGYFIAKFAAPAWRYFGYSRLLPYLAKYYVRYARRLSDWAVPMRKLRQAARLVKEAR